MCSFITFADQELETKAVVKYFQEYFQDSEHADSCKEPVCELVDTEQKSVCTFSQLINLSHYCRHM